jgi:hypothetical protein
MISRSPARAERDILDVEEAAAQLRTARWVAPAMASAVTSVAEACV